MSSEDMGSQPVLLRKCFYLGKYVQFLLLQLLIGVVNVSYAGSMKMFMYQQVSCNVGVRGCGRKEIMIIQSAKPYLRNFV